MKNLVSIDLGLAVATSVIPPGIKLTHPEIAAFCGCTPQAIQKIEYRAIRKMRKRMAELDITFDRTTR